MTRLRVSWWRQVSAAQRAAMVTFIAAFVVFVVSGLMLDGKSERRDVWYAITTALGVAVPLLAIGLAWWIGAIGDAPPAADSIASAPDDVRRRPFHLRFAIVLFLGLFWLTRRSRAGQGDWLDVALFLWWLVAIALVGFVIPRFSDRRRLLSKRSG